MTHGPDHPNAPEANPADQAPPAEAAALARKRKWDRITLIVVVAMVALWGTALIFHKTIRANYWAWRLGRGPAEPDRSLLINSLVGLGDESTGPALRLTRSDRVEARLAGQEVLLGLIERQKLANFRNRLSEPVKVDLAVAERFRQLLEDPSPKVVAKAIEGVEQIAPDAAAKMIQQVLSKTASPDVRAQAIESLGMHTSKRTMEAIADVLEDDRTVTTPPASILFKPGLLAYAQQIARSRTGSAGPGAATQPASQPASQPIEQEDAEPVTVADYAARMLQFMTHKQFGLLSHLPPPERAKVVGQYRQAVSANDEE